MYNLHTTKKSPLIQCFSKPFVPFGMIRHWEGALPHRRYAVETNFSVVNFIRLGKMRPICQLLLAKGKQIRNIREKICSFCEAVFAISPNRLNCPRRSIGDPLILFKQVTKLNPFHLPVNSGTFPLWKCFYQRQSILIAAGNRHCVNAIPSCRDTNGEWYPCNSTK